MDLEDEIKEIIGGKLTETVGGIFNKPLEVVLSGAQLTSIKGDKGDVGPAGQDGIDGKDGKNGKDGAKGPKGDDGKNGKDGIDGKDGLDGKDGVNGKDGSPDTPDQVFDKLSLSKKKIPKQKVEGLEDIERIAKSNIYTGISETRALELIAANGGGSGTGYTNLTQFVDQTAWRVFYSNTNGDITELALGADGTFLKSNGASSAPTFSTPAGSGDVSKVGTPVNNQVGVWTGDGTLEGDTALTFDTTTDTLATGIVTVTDDAYAAGWNGSTAVPTKNAIYDKIETLGGGVSESLAIAYACAL